MAMTVSRQITEMSGSDTTKATALPATRVEPGPYVEAHNSPIRSNVKIHYSGRTFLGHKIILAMNSTVFMKMFTGGFIESTKDEIELHDDDPAVLEGMFAFIYGVEIAPGDTPLDAVKFYLQLFWIADKYDCKSLVAAAPSMIDSQLPQLLTDLSSASPEHAAKVLDEVISDVYDTVESTESIKKTVLQRLFSHPDTSPLELAPKLSAAVHKAAVNFAEVGRDMFFVMLDLKGEKKGREYWTKVPGWCKVVEVKCAHCNHKWVRPAKSPTVKTSRSLEGGNIFTTFTAFVDEVERCFYCDSLSARLVVAPELSRADIMHYAE